MMENISWKKDDFEIRTVNRFDDGKPYVELVKWDEDSDGRRYCYTLAYFQRSSEGNYSLIFVSDRPFRHIAEIDIASIWKQLFLTQLMLEDEENE